MKFDLSELDLKELNLLQKTSVSSLFKKATSGILILVGAIATTASTSFTAIAQGNQTAIQETVQLPTNVIPGGSDILGIVLSDGRFKTLATALKASGLLDTLKQDGPFTLFAPTDEAFDNLPPGTLDQLMQPENKDQLASLLKYHVVPGKVTSGDLKSGEVTTAEGSAATVDVGSDAVMIEDAKVIDTDIEADNGVVHVVDKVIMLPE
ncbi:MAG: fasciclin domain-containing protein [Microcoleaceae cyanobacterium]